MRGIEQIPTLYDAFCAVADWRGLGRWRDWLCSGASGTTLEVGSGTGRNLTRYPPTAFVIAVEPDAGGVERARRRQGSALLVRADVQALPFRPGAFDTVVSSLVFCTVPDVPRGLAEIRRVLKPAGALRMLEHVRSTSPAWAAVQDAIQPVWTRVAGGCHNNRSTEAAVTEAGFAIDTTSRRVSGTLRRFVAR